MALLITWDIARLERTTADGKVITVHYTIEATDGGFATSAYGSIGLAGDMVVPYAKVTKAVALQWVKDGLRTEGIEKLAEVLQGRLDDLKDPQTALGLPWSNQ